MISAEEINNYENKKLVFVSIPMHGFDADRIGEFLVKMHKLACVIFDNDDIVPVCNYMDEDEAKDILNIYGNCLVSDKLAKLGVSLSRMSMCEYYIGLTYCGISNPECLVENCAARELYDPKHMYFIEPQYLGFKEEDLNPNVLEDIIGMPEVKIVDYSAVTSTIN